MKRQWQIHGGRRRWARISSCPAFIIMCRSPAKPSTVFWEPNSSPVLCLRLYDCICLFFYIQLKLLLLDTQFKDQESQIHNDIACNKPFRILVICLFANMKSIHQTVHNSTQDYARWDRNLAQYGVPASSNYKSVHAGGNVWKFSSS